jgi:hypothetical protein
VASLVLRNYAFTIGKRTKELKLHFSEIRTLSIWGATANGLAKRSGTPFRQFEAEMMH